MNFGRLLGSVSSVSFVQSSTRGCEVSSGFRVQGAEELKRKAMPVNSQRIVGIMIQQQRRMAYERTRSTRKTTSGHEHTDLSSGLQDLER